MFRTVNRFTIAVFAATAAVLAYVVIHAVRYGGPGPLEALAAVAVSSAGFVLNGALLWDVAHYDRDDLGKLGHAKNTLVLSLLAICVATPYALYSTFSKMDRDEQHMPRK